MDKNKELRLVIGIGTHINIFFNQIESKFLGFVVSSSVFDKKSKNLTFGKLRLFKIE